MFHVILVVSKNRKIYVGSETPERNSTPAKRFILHHKEFPFFKKYSTPA